MSDKPISDAAVKRLEIFGTEESGDLSPLLKAPHSKNITLADWNELIHSSDRNFADVRRVYDVLKKALPELENYTTEQVAAILTTIQAINTTLGQHQDGLTTLNTTFSKQISDVNAKLSANSVADAELKNTTFNDIARLDKADVAKISVEDTGRFGVYTLRITFNDSSSVSTEFDLPLEAVQIASVDDYVSDDGKRYLKIRFVDENITPLNIELDDIFNIEVFEKQFVERLESEYNGQVYAQDGTGTVHLARMDAVPYANSVVKRASDASIIIRDNPSRNDEAVHKKYVDDVSRYDVCRHVELEAPGSLSYVHVQITFDTMESSVNSCILTISEEYAGVFGPAKFTETHTVSTHATYGVSVDTPFAFRKLVGVHVVDNSLTLSFRVPNLKAASYTVWVKGIVSRVTDVSIDYSNTATTHAIPFLSESTYIGYAVPSHRGADNLKLWVSTGDGGVLKYKSNSGEWLPVAGGGSSQPYDVATERVMLDYEQKYLKLTIDNLLDGKYYSFQPFDMVCVGDDEYPLSSICTVTVEAYDNVKMLVYNTEGAAETICPKYYTSENGNVYLYFSIGGNRHFQVFIRGLVEKCTGATLEIVDSLPENATTINIDQHVTKEYAETTFVKNSEVDWQARASTIVKRNSTAGISANYAYADMRSSQAANWLPNSQAVVKEIDKTVNPVKEDIARLESSIGSSAPEVHVGTEAPTGSEVLWLDTDEESSGGSGGSGSGGGSKLYHHTVTVYWDYSYEDGPHDESVLCYFFSGSKAPINSLAEIPLDSAILPAVFDMSYIGLSPFMVTELYKTTSGSIGIEGYEFDGSLAYDANWHGFRDKVTEVV